MPTIALQYQLFNTRHVIFVILSRDIYVSAFAFFHLIWHVLKSACCASQFQAQGNNLNQVSSRAKDIVNFASSVTYTAFLFVFTKLTVDYSVLSLN